MPAPFGMQRTWRQEQVLNIDLYIAQQSFVYKFNDEKITSMFHNDEIKIIIEKLYKLLTKINNNESDAFSS
jgi:hypothetical protein